jgi:hypothetical protein
MEKGDAFYGWNLLLQGVLFVYLAIPLAFALSPWLNGAATYGDVFNVMNFVALITLTWTWNYLKAANRIAADAMLIERPDFYWWPPKPTRWQRLKTSGLWDRRRS